MSPFPVSFQPSVNVSSNHFLAASAAARISSGDVHVFNSSMCADIFCYLFGQCVCIQEIDNRDLKMFIYLKGLEGDKQKISSLFPHSFNPNFMVMGNDLRNDDGRNEKE